MTDKPKTPHRRRWLIALAIIVALLIAARIALPFGIEWAVRGALTDRGITIATGPDISLSLTGGRIEIENLAAEHETGEPLNIGHIHADISWSPLGRRQFVLENLQAGAIESAVRLDNDGNLFISGMTIPLPDPNAPPPESPWLFEIAKLDVAGTKIGIAIEEIESTLNIDQLGLEHLGTIAPEKRALVDCIVSIDDAPLIFGGDANPFHVRPGTVTEVSVEGLDVAPFAPLFESAGIYDPAGRLSFDLEVDAAFHRDNETLDITAAGDIAVADFNLNHAAAKSESITTRWSGTFETSGNLGELLIAIAGALHIEPLTLNLPSDNITIQTHAIDWKGQVNLAPAAVDLLTITGDLAMAAASVYLPTDATPMLVKTENLKLHVEPFDWRTDQTFSGIGTLTADTLAFRDENNGLDTLVENSDISFDLAATSDEPGILGGNAAIEMNRAELETIVNEETMIASVDDMSLSVENFATPLGGDNLFVQGDATLSLARASAENAGGYDTSVGATEFNGSVHVQGDPIVVGDVSVREVGFSDRGRPVIQGSLGQIATTGLRVYSDNRILANDLTLSDVHIIEAESPGEDRPHAIRLGNLSIAEPRVDATSFTADRLSLNDVDALIQRLDDGTLALTELGGTDETAEPETPGPAEASDPFRVAISQFELAGENAVRFIDTSLDPNVEVNARQLSMTFDNIDTTSNNPSPFSFDAAIGKYGEVAMDGNMSLNSSTPTGEIHANAKGVDLTTFDPYTRRYIGYRLHTGKLDYNVDLKLDAGKIDATSDLALLSFNLERLTTNEQDELTNQIGVPVNTAVSLLRDSDGAVRLKIPIQGDMTNPSFGIGDAIRKATFNAMKSGVTAVFAPIGMVIGAANKVRFDPIPFSPGANELSPEAIEILTKTAELMKKRPKVVLRFCGRATANEISAKGVVPPLIPSTDPDAEALLSAESVKELKEDAEEALPGDEALRKLARERSTAVIQFLVNDQVISPDRLVECTPVILKEEDAKPHVSIAL